MHADSTPPQSSTDEPPADGIFGLADTPSQAATVIVGVPWEATTSYGRGTAAGPAAIHAASVQVDLYDVELGEPHRGGVAMVVPDDAWRARAEEAAAAASRVIAAYDAGEALSDEHPDRVHVDEASRRVDAWVEAEVARWLEAGKLVGVVGGDHSCALGAIRAHAARFGPLGVLQFDAHADLRVAYQGFAGSHASVMHNVLAQVPEVERLVGVGLRDLCRAEHDVIVGDDRVRGFFAHELARRRGEGVAWRALAAEIADALPAQVYVSFDVDGLDPTLCPNTGTPVPGGLGFDEAMAVLRAVVASGRRIVGFDLCEVAPATSRLGDGAPRRASDEWDANVGARLLYKLIGWARRSHEGTLAESVAAR